MNGSLSMVVDLHITEQELLKLYRGTTQTVQAKARDGRTVQFPANVLQPYVTHDGVHGTFRIVFDSRHKLQRIEPLD